MIQFGDQRLPESFWSKVAPCPMSGCWLWCSYGNQYGYGQLRANGKLVLAHRHAFSILVDEIPSGLQIDHRCRVRCCVNPAHLEAVSHAENVRRGEAGLVRAAQQRSKTHCPQGHEYSEANTYLFIRKGRTERTCRSCWSAASARSYQKKIAAKRCTKEDL